MKQAAADPALGRLFPYTSTFRLCFSRCTGYPFSGDCPLIVPDPAGEHFQVIGLWGAAAGGGDAAMAVSLAVNQLPSECGAAMHGTAADVTG